jgi:hypothetical protein
LVFERNKERKRQWPEEKKKGKAGKVLRKIAGLKEGFERAERTTKWKKEQ